MDALASQANKAQQAIMTQNKNSLVSKDKMTEAEQIYVNAALIASMTEAVKPADTGTINANNIALLTKYANFNKTTLDDLSAKPTWMNAALWANLSKIAKLPTKPILGFIYKQQCRAAHVPIPPTWGDFGPNGWQSKGKPSSILDTNFLTPKADVTGIITTSPPLYPHSETEVFYYVPKPQEHNGAGICIALPIRQHTDTDLTH